jgi:uncharacterized protein (DUF1501 family)
MLPQDTHNDLHEDNGALHTALDDALDAFSREMKAQGVWDNVTVVTTSDFGRTLTSNGLGTGKCLSLPCIICGAIPARCFPVPME